MRVLSGAIGKKAFHRNQRQDLCTTEARSRREKDKWVLFRTGDSLRFHPGRTVDISTLCLQAERRAHGELHFAERKFALIRGQSLLLDAQLFAGGGTEALGAPGRGPDNIDVNDV